MSWRRLRGLKVIPPSLAVCRCCAGDAPPDADVCWPLNLARSRQRIGHRGFTSVTYFFALSPVVRTRGTTMVSSGQVRCWPFLTVSLLSHSLLIRSPRVVKASDGCGRGQMNVFAPRQVIKVAPFALSLHHAVCGHQALRIAVGVVAGKYFSVISMVP